ncbi:uncharacterized protein LOC129310665 isoform X2 [Prosopis cineraria]|uniref:uncharacterized protein LOC129310665 isoform X2 n=1 Tax=Prosopis cineraria TaxID=364024 RepID=UPI00240ED29E|nr:uncharacterized protein LOC129310665 isoform X2 [Prosopis cineraria]
MGSLIAAPLLDASTSTESEIAWHLASLLLSLGHPAHPADLASRCNLVTASPELVEFLCSIPESPILLTSDFHVTLSAVAIVAVGRFISVTDFFGSSFIPRFGIRVSSTDGWGNSCRKRKRRFILESDFLPVAKRGITCHSQHDELDQMKMLSPKRICDDSSRIILQSNGAISIDLLESSDPCKVIEMKETFESRTSVNGAFKDLESTNMPPLVDDTINCNEVGPNVRIGDSKISLECQQTSWLMSSGGAKPLGNMIQPSNTTCSEMPLKGEAGRIPNENRDEVNYFNEKSMAADVKNMDLSADPLSLRKFSQSSLKTNAMPSDATVPNLQDGSKTSQNEEKRDFCRGQASLGKGQKKNCSAMHVKEKRGTSHSTSPEDKKERKELPTFESYIVEEEEGSGAYGVVYKARRKSDGATVAIKCPHAKAHGQYVTNELKVLERFGGKNFIIKYEGSFKNGNTDCFVLEHIEHDRPEVLRKEIDIVQLRWYGYCMFRALATLHKRGVIHRDVKPGNFLFSRKLNKGYLIDFNLAKDLHQKPGNITSTKGRKFSNVNFLEATNQQTTNASKSILDPRENRRKSVVQPKTKNDRGSGQLMKSQGADGSGVTSAKDVTSTRTSLEKRLSLVKPRRKELISILQETLLGPNQEPSNTPMRKRVPAPRSKMVGEHIYVSPMPLNSIGNDVTGAGFLRSKGNGKQIREGSCVGTKGFRAPEVLFRSPHQGPKLDIWSAGVSLLYLVIGKTAFTGDPEQNIKDIAKLRGSEDLWEVAKLHNRESSFPADLYDKQSLPSLRLRDWCSMNTKRPEFLEVIPGSLFDLLDKCLMVNPRLRIGAEEALQHEFFAPCHESLRKERQCKKEF